MNQPASSPLVLHLGVKTDPIEYRFSYDWLFRLMAEEGVFHLQLGTFFEMYQLPDAFFDDLRAQAEAHGIRISSMFTSHRELGGFFSEDPRWQAVARRNYERLIEIGALVGARSVGSNPGAVLRDQMAGKSQGVRRYLDHMHDLMAFAARAGVHVLTIEPMSCLAEPPTLPEELEQFAAELQAYHRSRAGETAAVGYCADVSHGYVDAGLTVRCDHFQLLEPSLPYLQELHLRNTDRVYGRTFGFTPEERDAGIVEVEAVREFLLAHAGRIPVRDLVGYFEIGGPKLGRDYSDSTLEKSLRQSLAYLRDVFPTAPVQRQPAPPRPLVLSDTVVQIAPSMMCADMCHLEEEVRRLEAAGADLLHFDLMDGHFVPNMPMGLVQLEQLRALTDLPFDVHLMVDNNDFFVSKLAGIGVQQIAVHPESAVHLDRTLALIREAGIKAGVALNPATPLAVLDYCREQLDFVLLMTVNPGFAGQKRVPSALRKIAECRTYLQERAPHIPIAVDGNVSFESIPEMVAAGADILIAGTSSVFHRSGSVRANVRRTREAIAQGLARRNTEEQPS